MEKYFIPYELALELKKLAFNKECLGYFFENKLYTEQSGDVVKYFKSDLDAPLYQQVIDWFEKEYNIFIGRTCYDDGKTPKRWAYHVDSYYVQEQSYDGAIRYAIDKIKNKVR